MTNSGDHPVAPTRTRIIVKALPKLKSAESNLDQVETHLKNVEGAHADDQDEIASAKSSTNTVDDALKAAKAALEKVCP